MEWLKINTEGEVEFNSEEIKLIPELQSILSLKYNKQKGDLDGRKRYKALAELKYLYLVHSSKSPYRDYSDLERLDEAKKDCNFSQDWEESTELKLLIPKFIKGNQNKLARLLATTEKVLDKLDFYFNNIDLQERDEKGAYVNDPKKVMEVLKQLPSVASTLQELERQVKVGSVGTPKSKGDHELGWEGLAEERPNRQEDGE